jgi:hypothetical protein
VTATATGSGGSGGSGGGSTSFTFTISGGGGVCSGQLLGKSGFETGLRRSVVGVGRCGRQLRQQPARSGSWKAWLDGYGTTHTEALSQTVSIPAGCGATLSFYLRTTRRRARHRSPTTG